jgi:hypothetical protein
MEAGLRSVFWIGAVTMLIAFLIISTIPPISIPEVEKAKPLEPATNAQKAAAGRA